MRRSLTISNENERRIQGLRSTTLGLESPVDLDYTATVNLLIELGFSTLERTGRKLPPGPDVPGVPLDHEESFRILLRYVFAAVKGEETNGFVDHLKEFLNKDAGVDLLKSLSKLSSFQPKPSPQSAGREVRVNLSNSFKSPSHDSTTKD